MSTGIAQHFRGAYARFLVGYVRREQGQAGVDRLLAEAGVCLAVDDLNDPVSWLSFDQLRRLLEAGRDVLGGDEQLARAGADADLSLPELVGAVQRLGSVDTFYEHHQDVQAVLAPIVELTTERVGPQQWLVRRRFAAGFEPFRAFCSFSRGVAAVEPVAFGFPPAQVTEERCQCDGAPWCEVRIRIWDTPERETDFWRIRQRVAEERLLELEGVIEDLVGDDDLEAVLERIMAAAARATGAGGVVLELSGIRSVLHRVYRHGVGPAQAETVLRRLETARPSPDLLVAAVASSRHHHGRLVALHHSGSFLPHQVVTLDTYARSAAAVLDSAQALQESREHAARSAAVLELATELGETSSSRDIACRLAQAVPAVIGCDQAMVSLVPPGQRAARLLASVGVPPEVERRLAEVDVPPPPDLSGTIVHLGPDDAALGDADRMALALTGSAGGVVVPIVVEGAWAGDILASVVDDPARLEAPEIELRLRALAAQAAIAVRNAALLGRVRDQALHDDLTGLPNRALILDRLGRLVERARRRREPATVLFVDLDDFKEVNDSFGHAAGDLLIRLAAQRLAGAARVDDTVGRLGGDEFVVLVEGANAGEGVAAAAERLVAVLRQPYDLRPYTDRPVLVTASVGVATGDGAADSLLRDADIALYQAKDRGKAVAVSYEPAMGAALWDRLEMEVDLRGALQRSEFSLVFQPVVDLATGDLAGAEALLRWQHPRRGELAPDAFLGSLERSGLIVEVGRWVLVQALREARGWQNGGSRLTVGVNLSARQLESPTLVHDLAEALEASGADPALVVVEVAEASVVRDVGLAGARFADLKALGVQVAIDGFGTAYAAFAHLHRMSVDQLKLDRAFVSALGEDEGVGTSMISALVHLGRSLGLTTVAQGVERPSEHRALRAEACDRGQGYLFSHPLSAEEFRDRYVVRGAAARR